MTSITGIWNLESLGGRWRNKTECVAAHVHVGDSRRDLGHMASDTFAAGRSGFVVCMLFDGRRARPIWRVRTVALQAHHACRLQKVRIIPGPVHVMATETGYAACVHHTGDKIVTLHPILVRPAVRETGRQVAPRW